MTEMKEYLICLEETECPFESRKRQRKFIYRFRMKRESFFLLRDHFRRNARDNEYARGWSLIVELLVFIRWITSGGTYVMVGDTFGMPLQTVSDIVHQILPKVAKLSKNVIALPEGDELPKIAEGFQKLVGTNVSNFVVGAIDGTLIRFSPSRAIRDQYIDRKSGASINCTIVCDDKLRIRYMIAGYPGSVHDC